MQEFETILVEQYDGVVEITLNVPAKYNALSTKMSDEIGSVLDTVAADDQMRCVLLTAAGKGFCAGQDLSEVSSRGTDFSFIEHLETSYNKLTQKMRNLEVPIVCAINGVAAGAGFGLSLATDIRYLSERVKFVPAFIGIGLVPDSGVSYWLPRLIGLARATEMLMTNERVSADDAVAIGLANRVFSHETFLDEARGLARKLASGPTLGIGLTKKVLNHSLSATFAEQLAMEADMQQIAGHSADYQEGVTAFHEKRKPVFTGK